jgi:hypothetical protein
MIRMDEMNIEVKVRWHNIMDIDAELAPWNPKVLFDGCTAFGPDVLQQRSMLSPQVAKCTQVLAMDNGDAVERFYLHAHY